MQCKFLSNGLAISYDQVVKPCCTWNYDKSWSLQNSVRTVDLTNWHSMPSIIDTRNTLESGIWPQHCKSCQDLESQGRNDSIRGNGLQAYQHYGPDDITLEIRPGNTCNFACQTCWPEASSRVADFQKKAGILNNINIETANIDNFDFLLPIQKRIRNVVLLGGEPFYDKNCKAFLTWATHNLDAEITLFTNGSHIDYDFLQNYAGEITLVFSIDALGPAAEYIRYGTIWSDVQNNYLRCKAFSNVQLRVNITCSVYNYWHLPDVIDWLLPDWPCVVSFGRPHQPWLTESVVPVHMRSHLQQLLTQCADKILRGNIEHGQLHNAYNAVTSIVGNLQNVPWDRSQHEYFRNYVLKLDQVKKISIKDYLTPVSDLLFNSQS